MQANQKLHWLEEKSGARRRDIIAVFSQRQLSLNPLKKW